MSAERDRRWIEACNRGDAAAFDELYAAHRDWVLGLARRLTGSDADAHDVLQETFLYLLSKLPGLALSGRLTTLLYPAVRHLARDVRERRGRRRADDAALATVPGREPEPAAGDEEREHLAALVATLPEGQREVLLLRTLEGFSLEEIAEALAIPLGTVKSRLHHALAALRADPRTARYFDA